MYTFTIQAPNGNASEYKHIVKVEYSAAAKVSLEGDAIFTHNYKTCYDLHLFSEQDAYTVSKNAIEIIQISKENVASELPRLH